MNILYLIPSLGNSGGMERILTEKANHLAKDEKLNIFILTTEKNVKPSYFELDKRIKVFNLNIDFNNLFSLNIFIKYFQMKRLLKRYRIELEKVLFENKIDICISLGGKELEFFYKLKYKCKKICELHFAQDFREQFLISRSSNYLFNLIGKYRTKQLIKQTQRLDCLVVLTKADLEQWRLTNSNVVQIYNFTPYSSEKKSKLINKNVIAIGRLDPQKGFDLLIESWDVLKRKSNNDWVLNIFGDGQDKNILEKKIKDKKLEKSVFLRGNSSKINEELLESSIMVLSSRYEGFPMVILEAISFGIPIVAFNCKTGPNEIIENNDCGYLIDLFDLEGMADSIINLIKQEDDRFLKGQLAKDKSILFQKDVIMQQWISLFKTLLDE